MYTMKQFEQAFVPEYNAPLMVPTDHDASNPASPLLRNQKSNDPQAPVDLDFLDDDEFFNSNATRQKSKTFMVQKPEQLPASSCKQNAWRGDEFDVHKDLDPVLNSIFHNSIQFAKPTQSVSTQIPNLLSAFLVTVAVKRTTTNE